MIGCVDLVFENSASYYCKESRELEKKIDKEIELQWEQDIDPIIIPINIGIIDLSEESQSALLQRYGLGWRAVFGVANNEYCMLLYLPD